MGTLYLVRGLPGSGKSTLARKFKDAGLVTHVFEADDWFVDDLGNYNFNAEELPLAHDYCQRQTDEALTAGHSVAVANTFTTAMEMSDYIAMARWLDIPVVIVTCTGNFGSTHGVPEDVIERMRDRWEAV